MAILIGVLLLALLIVVGVAVWLFLQKRRSDQLRAGFGPEYERTVRATGDRGTAEKDLAARTERVEALHIRPLPPGDRARFTEAWRQIQARFVDDPGEAVGAADTLIGEVMRARGYPVGDFEQRAADISVDHPQVVTNYRAGHRIAQAQGRGPAATEELRQALVHYRALFEELLEGEAVDAGPAQRNGQQEPRTAEQEAQR